MLGEMNRIAESNSMNEPAIGWGALARPPETIQAGLEEPKSYPLWGSKVEHRDFNRKAQHPGVGSEHSWEQHLPGSMVGQGVHEKA